jgi:hypothetical protein
MGYDYEVIEDGTVYIVVRDHEDGIELERMSFKVVKGQKFSYDIYSKDGVIKGR